MATSVSTLHSNNVVSVDRPAVAVRQNPAHFAVLLLLIVAAALPDGLLIPILKPLLVDRFGLPPESTNWFIGTNLVGAMAAVPLIRWARRLISPAALLALAAGCNGILLVTMTMTSRLDVLFLLRGLEGAADIIVVAVLFDLIVKCGPERTRGRRLGLAGTMLLIAVALGMMLGGIVGRGEPNLCFDVASIGCATVAIIATIRGLALNGMVRCCPVAELEIDELEHVGRRTLWPSLTLAFADRAMSGLLTAAVPTWLAIRHANDTALAGRGLGLMMLMMALGAAPAGWLSDRMGHLRSRVLTATGFATGLLLLAQTDAHVSSGSMTLILAATGLVGAGMLPTALALTARTGRGSLAMGAFHAAGSVGFFAGVVGSGLLVAFAPNEGMSLQTFYPSMIGVAALMFIIVNLVVGAALHRRGSRVQSAISA